MNIISYCSANPRDYTYLGIGSKNRTSDLEAFTPELDQILPCFLNTVQGTIRVIHYDPQFAPEYDNGFLSRYFAKKGYIEIGGVWTTQNFRVEVIIITEMFTQESIFVEFMKHAIRTKTRLVVQAYSGIELSSMYKNLYMDFSSGDQAYIKNHVLFDITYGTDCNCATDMTKYAPLEDDEGRFLNFLLYTQEEKLANIGKHPQLDTLISKSVCYDLSKVLNENSVNYRKALKGEPLMFKGEYSQDASAEEIMAVLLNKVNNMLNILDRLKVLTPEKKELFARCSQNYRNVDVYAWYSEMTKLYK
jgi:hypothetical protein